MTICYEQDMQPGIQKPEVASAWQQRGYSCELWVDPPEQVGPEQRHPADELIMPITGALEIQVGNRVHCLQAGQELRIPAQIPHCVRNPGHGTVAWLYGFQQAGPTRHLP